jgi:hypothetical protein
VKKSKMKRQIACGIIASGLLAEQISGQSSKHIETDNKPPDPRQVVDVILSAATTTTAAPVQSFNWTSFHSVPPGSAVIHTRTR